MRIFSSRKAYSSTREDIQYLKVAWPKNVLIFGLPGSNFYDKSHY